MHHVKHHILSYRIQVTSTQLQYLDFASEDLPLTYKHDELV